MGYIINNGIPYGGGGAIETDTGWIALNDRIKYRVRNGNCTIIGESLGHISLENNVTKTVATLPSSITPSVKVRFCVNSCGSTDADAVSLVGNIATNGDVQIFCNNLDTTGLTFWSFSVTYPIDGYVGSIVGSVESNIIFMEGVRTAANESDLCLNIIKEFLNTGKAHGFINITWDGNDYFTGTISRYATSSAQLIIGRANQAYIIKAKSNGETITVSKIQ